MNQLGIAQIFTLCVLAQKRTEKSLYQDIRYPACMVLGAFCQLLEQGWFRVEEQLLIPVGEPEDAPDYLWAISAQAATQPPKALHQWMEYYTAQSARQLLRQITDTLLRSLKAGGLLDIQEVRALNLNQTVYSPDKQQLAAAMEQLRALLEGRQVTSQTLVLAALFQFSGLTAKHFDKDEQLVLRHQLARATADTNLPLLHQALAQLDLLLSLPGIG